MDRRASPQVSLIVATVERVAHVDALLASLSRQTWRDFDVVIVDQNDDDRLAPIVARYADLLDITRIRSPRGLSKSRNAGLAVARGAIIAFPDDDCRYRPETLARVAGFFATQPDARGLTCRAVAAAGERAPARFARRAHWLTRRTVWLGGMSCVIFLKAPLCAELGPFDEHLGLGASSPWIAAEESDYLARAVGMGARIRYEPDIVVEHPGPSGVLSSAYASRGAAYGRAFGYVMKRHDADCLQVFALVLRACAGAVLGALRGRMDLTRYHCAVARGRWRGWREGPCSARAAKTPVLAGALVAEASTPEAVP